MKSENILFFPHCLNLILQFYSSNFIYLYLKEKKKVSISYCVCHYKVAMVCQRLSHEGKYQDLTTDVFKTLFLFENIEDHIYLSISAKSVVHRVTESGTADSTEQQR